MAFHNNTANFAYYDSDDDFKPNNGSDGGTNQSNRSPSPPPRPPPPPRKQWQSVVHEFLQTFCTETKKNIYCQRVYRKFFAKRENPPPKTSDAEENPSWTPPRVNLLKLILGSIKFLPFFIWVLSMFGIWLCCSKLMMYTTGEYKLVLTQYFKMTPELMRSWIRYAGVLMTLAFASNYHCYRKLLLSYMIMDYVLTRTDPDAYVFIDNSAVSVDAMFQAFDNKLGEKLPGMSMLSAWYALENVALKCRGIRNSDACVNALDWANNVRNVFEEVTHDFMEKENVMHDIRVNVPYLDSFNELQEEWYKWTDCRSKFDRSAVFNYNFSRCSMFFVEHRYNMGKKAVTKIPDYVRNVAPLINTTKTAIANLKLQDGCVEFWGFMMNLGCTMMPTMSHKYATVLHSVYFLFKWLPDPPNGIILEVWNYLYKSMTVEPLTAVEETSVSINFIDPPPPTNKFILRDQVNYKPELRTHEVEYGDGKVTITHDVAKDQQLIRKNMKCPSLESIQKIDWNARQCTNLGVFLSNVLDANFYDGYLLDKCPKACTRRYQSTACVDMIDKFVNNDMKNLLRDSQERLQFADTVKNLGHENAVIMELKEQVQLLSNENSKWKGHVDEIARNVSEVLEDQSEDRENIHERLMLIVKTTPAGVVERISAKFDQASQNANEWIKFGANGISLTYEVINTVLKVSVAFALMFVLSYTPFGVVMGHLFKSTVSSVLRGIWSVSGGGISMLINYLWSLQGSAVSGAVVGSDFRSEPPLST